MDDMVVLARIVLRDPMTLAAGLALAGVIATGWMVSIRGRGWSRRRRLWALLSAASLGFGLSIVLARGDLAFGRSWYCLVNPGLVPGTPEQALNLVLYAPAAFFAALTTRRTWALLLVVLTVIVTVEVVQKLIDVGTCEVGDMTRNASGAVLAVLVVWLIRALRPSRVTHVGDVEGDIP